MARRKSTSAEESTTPDFEEALHGLEAIVEAMEHESLSLEELVAHYEKGTVLLTRCESVLQSARERIELITLRNSNEIAPESGAKTTKVSHSPSDDSDDDSDDDHDIRLF